MAEQSFEELVTSLIKGDANLKAVLKKQIEQAILKMDLVTVIEEELGEAIKYLMEEFDWSEIIDEPIKEILTKQLKIQLGGEK